MDARNRWLNQAHAALVLAFLCSPASPAAQAAEGGITPPAALRAAAEKALQARAQALGRPVNIALVELDPRLRVAQCSQPLDSNIVGDGELHEYTSVAVRCSGSVRWTVYLRASISTEVTVLTARGALPRGAEPTGADFETVRRTVPGTGADYPEDVATLRGLRLKMPLAAGEALTRSRLETAALIRRGQKVMLLAREGGIEIRVAAVALSDGRAAERIQVQNESSRRVVEGIVRDAAVVEVVL